MGVFLVSTGGRSGLRLRIKRQLVKLPNQLNAKKEDEYVSDEALALAA